MLLLHTLKLFTCSQQALVVAFIVFGISLSHAEGNIAQDK